MPLPTLAEFASRAEHWLRKSALPLWSTQGIDSAHGGFCERIAFSAMGDSSANKRIVVQARQIYVYSHATAMGLFDGLEYARQAVAFLCKHGFANGWVHQVAANGKVTDATNDTYDYAFVLLALGWYQHIDNEKTSADYLRLTMQHLQTLRARKGYNESEPPRTPRRQNPHMHLFEAALALYELTRETRYLELADEIFSLFTDIFFDLKTGVLREFFTDTWQPHANYDNIEPGHMMEWVWLLREYQRLKPDAQVESYCNTLFDNAITLGFHSQRWLLCDCVQPDGVIISPTQRCWPQTECVKAALVQAQKTGEERYTAIARKVLQRLFDSYLADCPAGGWRDTLDENMNTISATMPASTLYHLFVCMQQLLSIHGQGVCKE